MTQTDDNGSGHEEGSVGVLQFGWNPSDQVLQCLSIAVIKRI